MLALTGSKLMNVLFKLDFLDHISSSRVYHFSPAWKKAALSHCIFESDQPGVAAGVLMQVALAKKKRVVQQKLLLPMTLDRINMCKQDGCMPGNNTGTVDVNR